MTHTVDQEPFTRDLRRTVHLLQKFRKQYVDPDGFYSLLAADTASLVSQYESLQGRTIFDVGGGPGFFSDAFERAGGRYCSMELSFTRLSSGETMTRRAIVGDGQQMPIADGVFDICHSSNVIEHVPAPLAFLSEMVRVVRPGGLVFLAFTNWYSPFGGHDTSPWHYLGGARATARYERKHGHPPMNRFGTELFRLDISDVLGWARRNRQADIVDAFPRYYPSWARPIVSIPGFREVAAWNFVLVLRRR